MTQQRKIILLFSAGIVAIILLILLFTLPFRGDNPSEEELVPASGEPQNSAQKLPEAVLETADLSAEEGGTASEPPALETELSRFCATSAERYASFSDQSQLENITDLEVLMSTSMKQKAQAYKNELTKKYFNDTEFYGVSSRAISVQGKELNTEKGTAVFSVLLQLDELKGNVASIRYQNLKITLARQSETQWLIDDMSWEE